MKKEIAIIGYGRFGKTAAHHLKKHFRVTVADSRRITKLEPGVRRESIENAASKRIVILAVPIHRLTLLLKQISPFVTPGSLICDVCSVKEEPVKWMKQYLPSTVDILGVHPLFGPDSARQSLEGRTAVLCPVRISAARLRRVRSMLQKLRLTIGRMSPAQHDRLMAKTLFLTQMIGRGLGQVNLPETRYATQHFRFLHQLVNTANNDTAELFNDMYRYNRFARKIPAAVLSSFLNTISTLRKEEIAASQLYGEYSLPV
ncbi:MAG TPA: prephenate dehydrogenase/arogenate dehydrogenase family protein [Bacteroidota bacterium]|nr:prephenate dehydrogenase/arogenate dehydrogenase family protein [Bacteroidota bacterium]